MRRGYVRAGRSGRAWGDGGASGMHGKGPTEGSRARAERTENMAAMFVTLEVSKLSGWLNADASCRVERKAYDAERDAGREGGRAWGDGGASGMRARGGSD